MIPGILRDHLGQRLYETFGLDKEVGDFVYTVAALPSGHDNEYILEALINGSDKIKKAANIVLEEIT